MALPDDFSPWEHLQDVWRRVHNRRVREFFSDLPENDLDINSPRGALKVACMMDDNDTGDMEVIRTLLFWLVLGQASALHPPLYTMPTDRYQQEIKFAPQITLYFREDLEDVEEGYSPIDAEVSFRVMNETSETFTPTNAMALARRVQSEFATGTAHRWQKGRVKLNYRDGTKGYLLSINAYSEAEGKDLIRKVLSIQAHTLDESKLTISQLGEAPAIVPPLDHIYGESRRLPRRRPVGWVRFKYAECHVWGIKQPITLVDLTLSRRQPLLRDA